MHVHTYVSFVVELTATERGHDEQLRATVAFVLGLWGGDVPRDVFEEWVPGYLLPVWGDRAVVV